MTTRFCIINEDMIVSGAQIGSLLTILYAELALNTSPSRAFPRDIVKHFSWKSGQSDIVESTRQDIYFEDYFMEIVRIVFRRVKEDVSV
ncbi:unnamed protein product, partial [Mesorhabditis belari]|uniref:Uncharacterized protein n=1 Tax=Mesorhabditis belari TaxID=2138241 RepID=A0AAF3FPG6_9BILA